MGNAAVMGLFPRVRYVLLSDLLLETMSDKQIEAVFAHELGHVVHKHLWWFVAFIGIAMLAIGGPGSQVMDHARHWYVEVRHHAPDQWDTIQGLLAMTLFFGSFVLAFGFLGPRFERQADVYAARTIQTSESPEPNAEAASSLELAGTPLLALSPSVVGEYGAGVFAAALHRVAVINHIPVNARNWSHGSIAQRMRALHEMSASPMHTSRFDQAMRRLYVGLIASLCVFGVWNVAVWKQETSARNASQGMRVVVPPPAAGAGR